MPGTYDQVIELAGAMPGNLVGPMTDAAGVLSRLMALLGELMEWARRDDNISICDSNNGEAPL